MTTPESTPPSPAETFNMDSEVPAITEAVPLSEVPLPKDPTPLTRKKFSGDGIVREFAEEAAARFESLPPQLKPPLLSEKQLKERDDMFKGVPDCLTPFEPKPAVAIQESVLEDPVGSVHARLLEGIILPRDRHILAQDGTAPESLIHEASCLGLEFALKLNESLKKLELRSSIHQNAVARAQELEGRLAFLESEYHGKVGFLESQLKVAEVDYEQMAETNRLNKKKFLEFEANIAKMTRDFEESTKEKEGLEREIERLKKENDSLREYNAHLKEKGGSLQGENSQLKEENARLQTIADDRLLYEYLTGFCACKYQYDRGLPVDARAYPEEEDTSVWLNAENLGPQGNDLLGLATPGVPPTPLRVQSPADSPPKI